MQGSSEDSDDAEIGRAAVARHRFRSPDVSALSPAYFGLVMATGIVSLATAQVGLVRVSVALFAIAGVAYLVLWWLNLLRLYRHPGRVVADLINHLTGPGFFTMVAATGVLGSGFVLLTPLRWIGAGLWGFSVALWIVLTYAIFAGLTIKEDKPTLDEGISGAWLLAVVATQSVAVLAALLANPGTSPWRLELNFLALSMWLWGGMLYIWIMSLIFYRYTFFQFSPRDLSPPYWINMGAMAISALAGSRLILNAQDAWFLHSIDPFLKGFTVFYWASGTWWIPMLVLLGIWRHVYKRFPLRYDPLYWGAVFPLGMYAVGTHQMADAMRIPFIDWLATGFAYIALLVWVIAFAAYLRGLVRRPAEG